MDTTKENVINSIKQNAFILETPVIPNIPLTAVSKDNAQKKNYKN